MTFFINSVGAKSLSTVSVMSYNLENLFDTVHDEGKKDWTYLPYSLKQTSQDVQKYCNSLRNEYYQNSCLNLDWSKKILNRKITNLARVLSQYDGGRGADIVVFQEVENLKVLTMLVKKGLFKLGYKYITLIEGRDSRGIDTGVISKFPIRKQKIHEIDLSQYGSWKTRPILEVVVEVGDKTVTLFGNHWPNQSAPDATRVIASKVLRKIALASKSDLVIGLGDFNTSSTDKLNAIEKYILPVFEDVEVKGRRDGNVQALGTHWFRGHWQSLDKIFVLKKSLIKSRIRVNHRSFNIIKKPFMLTDTEWTDRNTNNTVVSQDIPNRFNPKTGEGFSDHLPVVVEFDL
jgi:endonuclease/exonuclease/phosphatase family metal-dependent hydrolase